jgi:hypothetical protein
MKTRILLYFLLPGVLAVSISCKKLQDEINHNPALNHCKITSISYTPDADAVSNDGTTRVTSFNAAGEPVKSIPSSYRTGNEDYAFQYDAKGNLKYWIGFYDFFGTGEPSPIGGPSGPGTNANLETIHSYTHDSKDNIVTDTFYYAGYGPPYILQSITYYSYDSYNRLTESKQVGYFGGSEDPSPTITKFDYDNQGNLKGFAYDNKLNFKRLSKVLMFITQDYSVNNRLADSTPLAYTYTYNKYNVPTKISGASLFGFYWYPGTGDNVIAYDCH